jgi:tetratricopeptide (TPR) repeat protein/tRNA A-37 threonylcarbamoyl transferase component Bud32
MLGENTAVSTSFRSASAKLERIVESFEAAWLQGQRPSLEEYLPSGATIGRAVLVELVHADLEYRLKAGEAVRVEIYLRSYPELAGDREVLLDLMASEYELRRRGEPDLTPEEYAQRFPEVGAELPSRLCSGRGRQRTWDQIGYPMAAASTLMAEGTAGTPLPATPPPTAEARYNPVRFHARGGLGEVLVARDEELQREVALKRIQVPHADDPENRRRFLLEAQITGRLEHPGVVPVYGLVYDGAGRPCYAMRFIEGESLKEAIDRFHAADGPKRDPGERRLGLRQLLTRFIAVCNTVAYAHSRGVLHRDIKPANIMLGKYGETLVVDWGLAKSLGSEGLGLEGSPGTGPADDNQATQIGAAIGTPAYMSPEQAAGRWDVVGPAADIYSLGATLYTLLTGAAPIPGNTAREVFARIERGDFPPPRQRKKDVPPALEAVCMKAMAHRPEDRYTTALTLAGDLESWLADEPVSTYREPWPQRLTRWTRRHRTLVAAGGVALVLGMLGLFSALYVWESAEQRRRQQADEFVSNLRSAAEANEALGLAELRKGRFAGAEKLFQEAGGRLRHEEVLQALRARLEARRQHAHRLVEFYDKSDEAERLEIREEDAEALARCESGLKSLAVFDQRDWWNHLPTGDLTPQQVEKLKGDVHRQLLFLGAIRAKVAFGTVFTPRAGPAYRAALEVTEAAQRFRPTRTGSAVAMICHFILGHKDQVKKLAAQEPGGAVDYYFMGVLHWWLAQRSDDPITKFVASAIGPLVTGTDFKMPMATAEYHLRQAARLQPRHFWTHLWLARVLKEAHKLDAAELALNTCVGLRPDYSVGYYLRGELVERLSWQTRDPARRARLIERALADLKEAIRLDLDDYLAYNARGNLYYREGQYPAAIDSYGKAIRNLPGTAVFHTNRANAYSLNNDQKHALADVNRALRLAPKDAWAFNTRGLIQSRRGRLDLAIADFGQAVRLQPGEADYLYNRGDAHFRAGHPAEAIADFTRAIRLSPGYAAAYNDRGNVYYRRGDLARAVADYNRAIRLVPSNTVYRGNRAACYLDRHDYARTIYECNEALRIYSRFERAYRLRGQAYLARGDAVLAGADFDTLLRLAPRNAVAYDNRAFARAQQGRWYEAEADMRAALFLNPDNFRTWAHLARLRLQRGDEYGYRRVCGVLMRRFGSTRDAQAAGEAAWTCVLRVDVGVDPAQVVHLAEKAHAVRPQEASYLTTLGAALYRAGRAEEAVKRLNEAVTAHGQGGTVADWAFLALAHRKLGHSDEAKKWRDRSIEGINRSQVENGRETGPVFWNREVDYQILRRELGD